MRYGSCLALILVVGFAASGIAQQLRRLPVEDYVDKMKAGWVGQMVGVGWGGPTEFKWKGEIIPENKMPTWRPGMVNQFHQDDIYVEMTFLRTLELHGFDVSLRQAGIDFANSGYPLWHANRAGRDNLRSGIAPPDSGHPEFNEHADDIDYQIEADFSGVIVARVTDVAAHPNADKLRVATLDTGDGPHTVVCGAWNFEAGALVPLALPGAVLPGGFEVGSRKIRGIDSPGMICSESELGIGEDAEGILVLEDGHAPLGSDFAETLPYPDVVFDLEITPNRPEAEALLGGEINSASDLAEAARALRGLGPKAVLVKGGHMAGPALDVLFDGREIREYTAPRIETPHTHGSGCTFSAAIATYLAHGPEIGQAVARAKRFITEAIRRARPLGQGSGPTNHLAFLERLPALDQLP